MKEKFNRYAKLLLKKCLNIKEGQPLLIEAPIENIDFIRILTKEAIKMGVTDIYYDFEDLELKHELLKNVDAKDLIHNNFWNKSIWDTYAQKGAAFLMLCSSDPDLMNDIDPEKMKIVSKAYRTSRPIYKEKQGINELCWCIACTSTKALANKIFNNKENAYEELWNTIFDICLINEDDSIKAWDEITEKNMKICDTLNNLHLKELHYTNSLGTNLKVELADNHIWCGAKEKAKDGRDIIVNMPTLEVFTTPIMNRTEGIVYSSKPLIYSGVLIEDFNLKFEKGKVVKANAKKGLDILQGIISSDSNSMMLGEVALVNYNSPISLSGKVFYETLYDENASCHLALGDGFITCLKDTESKTREELDSMGINHSNTHVDFMIGTKDLKIVGKTFDNKEYLIFEEGNFVI